MRVDYPEKAYENYFNEELGFYKTIYVPIGQNQEGILGYDTSAFSQNLFLLHLLGFRGWPYVNQIFRGVNFPSSFNGLDEIIQSEIDKLPKIKVNLLFQYKRPSINRSKNGEAWKYWGKEYFYYEIDKHQNDILIKIQCALSSHALVLYAAPALKTFTDLLVSKKNRQIIKNSNFKKASVLQGHKKNTYIKRGHYSIACSEQKEIPDIDLFEYIDEFVTNGKAINSKFIHEFVDKTEKIILEDRYFKNKYLSLVEKYDMKNNSDLFVSFIKMKYICDLTGLLWLIVIN
jgi:hypothetical protein